MKFIGAYLLFLTTILASSASFSAQAPASKPSTSKPPAHHAPVQADSVNCPHPSALAWTWKSQFIESYGLSYFTASAKHPVTGQIMSVQVLTKKQPSLTGVTKDNASGKCRYSGVTFDNVPFKKLAH